MPRVGAKAGDWVYPMAAWWAFLRAAAWVFHWAAWKDDQRAEYWVEPKVASWVYQ